MSVEEQLWRRCAPSEGSEEVNNRILWLSAFFLACLTDPLLSMGQDSKTEPMVGVFHNSDRADFNTDIYYRNKLEFSQEGGVLPFNIPFPFDAFVGVDYTQSP